MARAAIATAAVALTLAATVAAGGSVHFMDPVPPGAAEALAGVPGVVEAQADDTRIRLVVEGPVGPALQAAAGLEVQRIVTHEADLEDVFLSYYQEQPA